MEQGKFVISLDFELHWGVAELWNIKDRIDYFTTTRRSIPVVLNLFEQYKIHATWATVGFLFAKNKKQLLEFCPDLRPNYESRKLSYYSLIDNNEIGNDEQDDPFHYAHFLIEQIVKTPGQELGTHTFAHYYCNEPGQNHLQFDADLKAAQSLSKENFGIELQSLVFPRNQFNTEYIDIARKNGIKVARSNPDVWFWRKQSKFTPLARAADALFSISTPLAFKEIRTKDNEVLLLPASRFLRAYSEKEKMVHNIKLSRIKKEMTYAAQNGLSYHLWWHPHNFGYFLEKNLIFLEQILKHYQMLNEKFGFESNSMIEMYKTT
ncbi:MAG: polysaccharide deacetylase family protein [Taibaiella sp.]|jgi:peptidoglycan/xylan/chitin deacetylase (PgdA/CDA1 family)